MPRTEKEILADIKLRKGWIRKGEQELKAGRLSQQYHDDAYRETLAQITRLQKELKEVKRHENITTRSKQSPNAGNPMGNGSQIILFHPTTSGEGVSLQAETKGGTVATIPSANPGRESDPGPDQ